jgi:hypothetical protein
MKIFLLLANVQDKVGIRILTWLSAALSSKASLFWAMNLDLAKYRLEVGTGVE